MSKEIICVYQDCVLCGDRGKKLKKLIFNENLQVRKVSFASEEGKNLIHEAVFKHKIGSMPFFTDGDIFSYNLEDFVKNCKKCEKVGAKNCKKCEEKPEKCAKSVKKSKKYVKCVISSKVVEDENN